MSRFPSTPNDIRACRDTDPVLALRIYCRSVLGLRDAPDLTKTTQGTLVFSLADHRTNRVQTHSVRIGHRMEKAAGLLAKRVLCDVLDILVWDPRLAYDKIAQLVRAKSSRPSGDPKMRAAHPSPSCLCPDFPSATPNQQPKMEQPNIAPPVVFLSDNESEEVNTKSTNPRESNPVSPSPRPDELRRQTSRSAECRREKEKGRGEKKLKRKVAVAEGGAGQRESGKKRQRISEEQPSSPTLPTSSSPIAIKTEFPDLGIFGTPMPDALQTIDLTVEEFSLAGLEASLGGSGFFGTTNHEGVFVDVVTGKFGAYCFFKGHLLNLKFFGTLREAITCRERTVDSLLDANALYIGVFRTPNGKWTASITVNKEKEKLGVFDSAQKAAIARDLYIAERGLLASHRLNFPHKLAEYRQEITSGDRKISA